MFGAVMSGGVVQCVRGEKREREEGGTEKTIYHRSSVGGRGREASSFYQKT